MRRYRRRLAAAAAEEASAAAPQQKKQQQEQEGPPAPRQRGRHKGPKLEPQAALCVCLSQLFGAEALLRIGRHYGLLTDEVWQAAAALAAAAAGGGGRDGAAGQRNGRHGAAAAAVVAAAAAAATGDDPAALVDVAAAALAAAASDPQAVSSICICQDVGPYEAGFLQALLLLKHTHASLTSAEVRRYMVAWHKGGPGAAALALPAKKAARHKVKEAVKPPRLMTVLKECTAALGLPEPKYASKQLKSSTASRSSSKGAEGGAGSHPPPQEQEEGIASKPGEGLLTIKLMLEELQLPLLDITGGVAEVMVLEPPAFVLEACHRNDGITHTSHQALQWMVEQEVLCDTLAACGLLSKVQQALEQHEAWQQHQREQLTQDLGAAGGEHLGVDQTSSEEELDTDADGRHGASKQQPGASGHSAAAGGGGGATKAPGSSSSSSKASKGGQRSNSSSAAKRQPQPYDLLQSCMAHLGLGQPMTNCSSCNCTAGKLHRAEVVLPAFKLPPCKSKQTKGEVLPEAVLEHHMRFCGYSSSCKVAAIQAAGIPALRWVLTRQELSQRVDDLHGKLPPCAQLLETLSALGGDSEQQALAAAWEEAQEAARAAAAAGLVVGPAEVDVLDGDVALPAALTALLRCCRALGWPPPQCYSQQKDGSNSTTTSTTLHLVGCQLAGEALEPMQWQGSSCHGRAAAQTQAALAALRWVLDLEPASQALREAGEFESVQSAMADAAQVAQMIATAMAEAEVEQMRLDAAQRQAAEEQERQRRLAAQQRRQQQQLEQHRQLAQAGYPGGGAGYMYPPPPAAYGGYPSHQAVPPVVPPPQQWQHREAPHQQQHHQRAPAHPRQQQAMGGSDPDRQQHLQQLRAMQQATGQQLAGRRGGGNRHRGSGGQAQQQQQGPHGVAHHAARAALQDLEPRR